MFKMSTGIFLSIYKNLKAQLSKETSCSLELDAISLENSHHGLKPE